MVLPLSAQVGVGTAEPDPSSIMDVTSTTKGFLPPRMTHEQLNSISDPADGLVVFCTDCGSNGSGAMSMFMTGKWYILSSDCMNPMSPLAGTHVPSSTQIAWNWNAEPYATGYKWNTTNDYASATDMGISTSTTETGLACTTPYTRYIWAYNTCGVSGATTLNQSTIWECGCSITDSRDDKTYGTVLIGTQCWLAQNLNYGTRINCNQTQSNNSVAEKYCHLDQETNCDIYGGLYQWNEMMQYTATPGVQGICPAGWHLPTNTEMTTLMNYLGGLEVAGGKLKETGTVHWLSPNTGATDEVDFTALPGSYRDYLGGFGPTGTRTSYWTSNPNGSTYAYDIALLNDTDDATLNSGAMKVNGFSVRCVKN
jgi:uncharacterized protein (TIGR02145 family)